MADQHDHSSKPTRAAPPFIGPVRGGGLAPQQRVDRPTLPPFSPPFARRPSPAAREAAESPEVRASAPTTAAAPAEKSIPPWLDEQPNEPASAARDSEVGITWVNPDEPIVAAPPQPATGIEWLDAPAPEPVTSTPTASADDDDVFGWDPAEERVGALDTAPSAESLDALKELEPWASPGVEPPASTSDDVASTLERLAARVRSGDLFVPSALAATSEEAVLAAVLAALLQRSRG